MTHLIMTSLLLTQSSITEDINNNFPGPAHEAVRLWAAYVPSKIPAYLYKTHPSDCADFQECMQYVGSIIGFDVENHSTCNIYTGKGSESHVGILKTYKNMWNQEYDIMSRYPSNRLGRTSILVVDNETNLLCPCSYGKKCQIVSDLLPGRCVPDQRLEDYDNSNLIPIALVILAIVLVIAKLKN